MSILTKFICLSCVFFILWGLISCQNKYVNVTTHPLVSHIANKMFVLKEDLFLVHYVDSNEYVLRSPGKCSTVARTIEDYLKDPQAWKKGFEKTIGIIPKGTKIYVYKVIQNLYQSDSTTYFFAKILNSVYSDLEVDILFLINHPFMEPSFSIDERYLEYCNELE